MLPVFVGDGFEAVRLAVIVIKRLCIMNLCCVRAAQVLSSSAMCDNSHTLVYWRHWLTAFFGVSPCASGRGHPSVWA
jgi:hypothetical protein